MQLAREWLGGARRGIEIGGSSTNRFDGVNAWNVEHPSSQVFRHEQETRIGEVLPVDVYGDAAALPFADGALDFVLTSHVLEHVPDTIRTLREWSRVVKDSGTLFMIVPHKERTMDAGRPRTPLEHHLADYATRANVAGAAMVPTSHYHVWTTDDVVQLIEQMNEVRALDLEIEVVEDVDSKLGNGFTVVARKRSQPVLAPESSLDAPINCWQLTLDLPFQVVGRTTECTVNGPDPMAAQGIPRGRYRAVPIHGSFPPRAGEPRTVEIGPPTPAPIIERVLLRDGRLRVEGSGFDAFSYLEADFGNPYTDRALPEFVDGALELDARGIAFPQRPFPVRAVTLPPGGGASATVMVDAHLV